jgi:acetylornithine deacetylase/succinyl-diaminopimelate desuccinylase-like protein
MRKLAICLLTFGLVIGALYLSNRPADLPPLIKQNQNAPAPSSATFNYALSVVNKDELKEMLYWFASPGLEGRMSGQKGNVTAKDYIVNYYKSLGFSPGVPNFTQTFAISNLNTFREPGEGKTANVVAMLPPNDAGVSSETIVIGAHFDHIGYGPSMSRTPSRREVHPGADDNASGTTALLGAAKILSVMKGQNRRRIVFVNFSAEEMGLVGAKHYVANNPYTDTVFMLNMDMVGRLRGKGVIDAFGAGNSPDVKAILEKINGYPFRPNITTGAGGGSDHAPFYQKGIPICFIHTGMHNDYHTPEDTPEKIDYDGLLQVTKYVANIMWEVDRLPSRPRFQGTVGWETEVEFADHDWKKTWK